MVEITPYERLAAAIVKQAAEDYHSAQERVRQAKRGGAVYERERCDMYLLEKWFYSDWCGALTFGNGERILRSVKKGEL